MTVAGVIVGSKGELCDGWVGFWVWEGIGSAGGPLDRQKQFWLWSGTRREAEANCQAKGEVGEEMEWGRTAEQNARWVKNPSPPR